MGNRCGFSVELWQDFGDEATFNSVSEEAIALNEGKSVVLDVSQELLGDHPSENFLVSLYLLFLLLLEKLDVFQLSKQCITFSC